MRKVFSIIFSLVLLFSLFTNSVYAADPLPFSGDDFIKAGDNAETSRLINSVDEGLGVGLEAILILLYRIGDVIAVCIFIYFGIRYLLATPQKKADLKASMFPYFVGLLLYIVGVPIAISIINIFINVF